MAKADIFSLGMTIFELAYERATNSPLSVKQRSQITQDDINLPGEMYDQEFVQLLRAMMQRDPNERPSADRILKHPLIRSDLAWQLEHEQQIVAALRKRLEELEHELLEYHYQRHSLALPIHDNKFDMPDLSMNRTTPTTIT